MFMSKIVTFEDFVRKAREKHGDKYLYDEKSFTGMKNYVDIYCKSCKTWFTQKAYSHAGGHGHRDCSFEATASASRMTKLEFKDRIKEYEKYYVINIEDFKGYNTPMSVHCAACGTLFSNTPKNLLRGNGHHCPVCYKKESWDEDSIIELFHQIHGDKYTYPRFVYKNIRQRITIKCNTCGHKFPVSLDSHKKGHGCKKCHHRNLADAQRKSLEKFIADAKAIHGDLYDYSLVEYRGSKHYVNIVCKRCGCTFTQKPEVHLGNKAGCPDCNHGSIKIDKASYLYILKTDDNTKIKVGITNNTFKRLERLHKDTPFAFHALKIYKFSKGTQIVRLEKDIHNLIAEHNAGLRGFDGATEWFWYSQDVVDLIETRVVEILKERLYHT